MNKTLGKKKKLAYIFYEGDTEELFYKRIFLRNM